MASNDSPHFVDIALDPPLATTLLRAKLPTFPTVTSVEDIKVGFNNRCYSISTADGNRYILRLTKDTWPATKIIAEAASLAAVAHYNLGIPVPKLVAYNEASDTELHVRWMLMQKMPGALLEDVWATASDDMRTVIAHQLRDILAALQTPRLERIGGWVFDVDGTTPVIGPYFDGALGPYETEKAWLEARFSSQVNRTMSVDALAPLRPFVPIATVVIEQYLAEMTPAPIVFFHGDFAFRNILVNDGAVTGILDWEWCGAMPQWKEWCDCSFEDRNVLNYVPSLGFENIAEFQARRQLWELIEGLAPWQVGAWPEKDAKYIDEAKQTIERCIAVLKHN
ncbi:hypothetical protein ACHHYP_20343 [Achlya hypogyna]|uniref:Aminoglycoside phosphotransferase domain-containing protein n=1 Tax=Achlya hypogyna TaxID=1202772 RepID=A0A1V9ZLD7_ACHHY|nr:hypothetical protein ACHHYP_20343 [Achlya hypogyna]